MQYRKKPVVIEAVQFLRGNWRIIERWSCGKIYVSPVRERTKDNPSGEYIQIETLEGVMTAIPGDWIIKGVAGEFYPCKPDIFEQTYELVE